MKSVDEKVAQLEEEIEKIHIRNRRVEADKAWETSATRKIFIAASTYILMVLVMLVFQVANPFLSAVIPTFGYLLSTLSLSVVKSWWLQNRHQK